MTAWLARLKRHMLHYFGVALRIFKEYCYAQLVSDTLQPGDYCKCRQQLLRRGWRPLSIVLQSSFLFSVVAVLAGTSDLFPVGKVRLVS